MAAHERSTEPAPLAIQLSRPFQTQEDIHAQAATQRGINSETRELQLRLSSCTAIHHLAQFLQFPARVAGTAMMVYHRFHLSRPLTDFNSNDVVVACLFVASKMEDTSKKARDILLAAHNLRNPQGPELNADSPQIEDQRRRIIGLERMILETQCFDFRQRHPHPFLIKFARSLRLDEKTTRQAWDVLCDSYRTHLPLKTPPHVIALASLLLASRFRNETELEVDEAKFLVDETMLFEALEDLLDLYMHCKGQAIAGSVCSDSRLMEIKTALLRKRSTSPQTQPLSSTSMHEKETNGRAGSGGGTSVAKKRNFNLTSIGDQGTCRYLIDPDRLASESKKRKQSTVKEVKGERHVR